MFKECITTENQKRKGIDPVLPAGGFSVKAFAELSDKTNMEFLEAVDGLISYWHNPADAQVSTQTPDLGRKMPGQVTNKKTLTQINGHRNNKISAGSRVQMGSPRKVSSPGPVSPKVNKGMGFGKAALETSPEVSTMPAQRKFGHLSRSPTGKQLFGLQSKSPS